MRKLSSRPQPLDEFFAGTAFDQRGPGDRRRRTVKVGARRRKHPVWSLLLALAAGCDAGTVAIEPDPLPPPGQWEANPRPVTVTVGPLTATLSAVGDTLRLTARVTDQYGQALTVPVAWSVDQPGVAAVDSAGLVTARSNGTAVVTATAGGVSGSATVTVAQAVAAVVRTRQS